MLVNGGEQISDIYFKRFVGILPKVPFSLLFKAVLSLSISTDFSVREIKILVY